MVDLPDEEVQPEAFTQSIETDAAPEALETPPEAPQATPEPDEPFVAPDWLDADPEPAQGQYPPQYPPELPPQYPPNQPAYPPAGPPQYQPTVPQSTGADAVLNEFVKDPEGWVRSIQQDTINQMGGQLSWQQQQLANQVNQIRTTYANSGIKQADTAIRGAYKILNADPTFRSNKEVQARVGAALKGSFENAANAAMAGDYGPISDVAQIDETAIRGMLAFVKATSNIPSPGVGPLAVEGATVESSRSPAAAEDIQLTPVQEEIAARMGPGYRDRMIKAEIENRKHNDLEIG